MYKDFTIILLIGTVTADSTPHISPGLQIGTNSENFFISVQTTVGHLPSSFGITAGLRIYRLEKAWKKYRYLDLQFWPAIMGIGIGKMIDDDKNMYTQFKTGFGILGHLTYDYYKNPKIGNHNFGLIGVMPIWDWNGYNPETG